MKRKRTTFSSNLPEYVPSPEWLAFKQRERNSLLAARAAAGSAGPRVPGRPPNVAAAMSTQFINNIAFLDALSLMSNANLLQRMQAPNKNNVERRLMNENIALLQRIRRLQGRNKNVQNINTVMQLRAMNQPELFRTIQAMTPNKLRELNTFLRGYNNKLYSNVVKIREFIAAYRMQNLLRRARGAGGN
jgi:hypothetical protein